MRDGLEDWRTVEWTPYLVFYERNCQGWWIWTMIRLYSDKFEFSLKLSPQDNYFNSLERFTFTIDLGRFDRWSLIEWSFLSSETYYLVIKIDPLPLLKSQEPWTWANVTYGNWIFHYDLLHLQINTRKTKSKGNRNWIETNLLYRR